MLMTYQTPFVRFYYLVDFWQVMSDREKVSDVIWESGWYHDITLLEKITEKIYLPPSIRQKARSDEKTLNFIGNILYIGMILWDVIEFLAIPALFFVIGLFNSFPWQYYAISIGGYFALFIILEIVLHFIFKALDKRYTPFIKRKFEKFFNKFPKED